MDTTLSRVLWIISGVLLTLCGVICIVNPSIGAQTLSVFLGLALLVSGIIDIVLFARLHIVLPQPGWILADGIITVLIALFLLGNNWLVTISLPILFGMWLIFTGISRFVGSFDLKKLGVKGWGWFTFLAVLLVVFGILAVIKPVAATMAIGIIIGVSLIVNGIAIIIHGILANRFFL